MYFVLVYDRSVGKLESFKSFGEDERGLALDARFDLERQHLGDSRREVIMLGADSREALVRTHSRYFKSMRELTDQAVERLAHPVR